MMKSRYSLFVRIVLLLFLVSGCQRSNQIESRLNDYTSRLARVLETPITLSPATFPPFPAKAVLLQSPPQVDITLTELYRLNHCELFSLVSERNTSLGKLHAPSTRYIYEVQLLNALQSCVQQTTDNPALLAQLLKWQKQKMSGFSIIWMNLLLGSEETYRSFTHTHDWSLDPNSESDNTSVQTLLSLTTLALPTSLTNRELEQRLQTIDSTRLLMKQWSTQIYLTSALNSLNEQLMPLLATLPCNTEQQKEKVKILRNVFQLFFIQQIQPVGSKLNANHYQLLPWYATLINHAATPLALKTYLNTVAISGFDAYKQAMREHVIQWQTLLSRCDISPK